MNTRRAEQSEKTINDQLESLNVGLRSRRRGPQRVRRTLERQIEQKAREQRTREDAAKSALKGLTKGRA